MWKDIFYPDNPKRREQLIRRNQEIRDLMQNNFSATNHLIDCMNKYMSCSFEHISLNESATFGKNCDVMIECMHKIQAEVERIDKKLKEKLEPTLYEKLRENVSSLSSTDYKAVSNAFEGVCGCASMGTSALFCHLVKNGTILADITSKFVKIGSTSVACVGFAVVCMGISMIADAIIGKFERAQLEAELEKYDRALQEFKPASENYQYNITYARSKIEVLNEKKMSG